MATQAGSLSGGEQQMIGMAQALLMRPRLLMIDELSLGLAPRLVERLGEALTEINRTGLTILLVEQDVMTAFEQPSCRASTPTEGQWFSHDPDARDARARTARMRARRPRKRQLGATVPTAIPICRRSLA